VKVASAGLGFLPRPRRSLSRGCDGDSPQNEGGGKREYREQSLGT